MNLSGIAQWVSGTPASVGFSTVQGTDLTGGGDGQRINIVGDPNTTGSTFSSWFNQAANTLKPRNSRLWYNEVFEWLAAHDR